MLQFNYHLTPSSPRICIWLTLMLPLCVADSLASWYGPEPFRRDRVDGREFEYEAESFLHRLSYEPMPLLQPAQRTARDGVFGTGGSTRSNELFVRQHVQLSLPTDTAAYLGYRFFRYEDFDGHYDQQHLGAGYQNDDWRLVFWGDVTGDKGDTSMQLEWALQEGPYHHLRVILAAPDALYNRKSEDDDEYQEQPYTWYAEGRARLYGQFDLYGFVNLNRPTRFRSVALAALVDDEQISAGLGVGWARDAWYLGLELEGLDGDRKRRGQVADSVAEQRLSRQFSQLTVEARRSLADGTQLWYGLRHLRFDEDDRRPHDPESWLEMDREESYLYAGRQWRLGQRTLFSPTLIGGYAEIDEHYPLRPANSKFDTGFIGKMTPAFVFELGNKRQGTITLSPTVYLHELGFGGGNVQLHFPL